jgi:RNA polymerase sigma-70 factor (ECF subfamily)
MTFDDVYQQHAQTVGRWVARLAGPGADCEDLTQDVFLVVARRLGEFRYECEMSTWLFSIAARVAANDRRKRRVRRLWLRLMPRLENHPGSTTTPSDLLDLQERKRRLDETLDRLSEHQRRAFVLFEWEELSVAEVASLMNLSPGNTRVLLHRARAAFARCVAEDERQDAKEVADAVRA